MNGKIVVYTARAMTGFIKADVVKAAKEANEFLEKAGFLVLDPVTSEGVKPTRAKLQSTEKEMNRYWPRDLEMVREAHVVFDFSPHMPSLGVIREHGYGQYGLLKKVISIFPEGKLPPAGAACYYEDAYVTDSLIDAIQEAYRTHGTFWKRTKWRVSRLPVVLRNEWHRLQEWFR